MEVRGLPGEVGVVLAYGFSCDLAGVNSGGVNEVWLPGGFRE